MFPSSSGRRLPTREGEGTHRAGDRPDRVSPGEACSRAPPCRGGSVPDPVGSRNRPADTEPQSRANRRTTPRVSSRSEKPWSMDHSVDRARRSAGLPCTDQLSPSERKGTHANQAGQGGVYFCDFLGIGGRHEAFDVRTPRRRRDQFADQVPGIAGRPMRGAIGVVIHDHAKGHHSTGEPIRAALKGTGSSSCCASRRTAVSRRRR